MADRAAGEGRKRSSAAKRELAIAFIRKIRDMDREDLHQLILAEAGEELAQFFLAYATDLIQREPERAVENASSLLLIGYLIRGFEREAAERTAAASTPWLH
jgi:hypothetical protein